MCHYLVFFDKIDFFLVFNFVTELKTALTKVENGSASEGFAKMH